MNNIDIKFDEKALKELGLDIVKNFIDNINADIECPNCKQTFHINNRETVCPYCNCLITVTADESR